MSVYFCPNCKAYLNAVHTLRICPACKTKLILMSDETGGTK